MTRLGIRHETTYRYGRPVAFGPQRLMVRPRDSHADRLVEASLELSQAGDTRWMYDALGNCICWYHPSGEADRLSIVSNLVIERFPAPLPTLADPHTAVPIIYNVGDRAVLEPFIAPTTDVDPVVQAWLLEHMSRPDEPALAYLTRLTRAIHGEFQYRARDEEGTQIPGITISTGQGTCRDFAWLMIELLRRLGYAARFVTGYLYSPAVDRPDAEPGHRGAGSTHAWCEVFLPALGWIEFDPTNGLAESPDLIRVASTRVPEPPIHGAIIGDPLSCEMTVKVEVRLIDQPSNRAPAPQLADA
ncbi:MAG: transglutaminase family protein [Caulobacteraceae bacterium]